VKFYSRQTQSKKANFDASHELEELLLEDNPLKAKARKQNRDINSLSAEMRQMEEQCVGAHATTFLSCTHRVRYRFTIYDFRAMHRRSYYPHNQQIITTVTASSSGVVASRPVTPGAGDVINGSNLIGLDSGLPDEYKIHSSEGLHHPPPHDISEKENV
jgi:serine/threonine kinase 32